MIQSFRVNKVYIIVFFTLLLDLIYAPKGEDSSRFIPLLFKLVVLLLGLIELIHLRRIRSFGGFVTVLITIVVFLALSTIIVRDAYIMLRINNLIKLLFWLSFSFIAFNSRNVNLSDNAIIVLILLVAMNIVRDSLNTNLLLGSGVIVSNYGYNAVRIFPLIYMIRNKGHQWMFLLLALTSTLISLKRGAILLVIILTYIYLRSHLLKTRHSRFLFISLLLFSILSLVKTEWFQFFIEARFSDFEDSSSVGSGRGLMFELIFTEWISSFWSFLFGHGYLATWNFFVEKTGHRMSAHSDFFEFVYDLGLLGIGFLLMLFRYLKFGLTNNRVRKEIRLSVYTIFLFTAVYTNNIFHPYFFLLIYSISLTRCHNTNLRSTVSST